MVAKFAVKKCGIETRAWNYAPLPGMRRTMKTVMEISLTVTVTSTTLKLGLLVLALLSAYDWIALRITLYSLLLYSAWPEHQVERLVCLSTTPLRVPFGGPKSSEWNLDSKDLHNREEGSIIYLALE